MLRLFVAICFIFSAFCPQNAQSIRLATYNIRFDNRADTLDLWEDRLPFVAGLIRLYDIDIFGTQEGLNNQLEDLKCNLSGYDYFGVGRDEGNTKGEHTAVFYKTNRYEVIENGTFWLSEITDKPNKGWDGAFPRICTWGKLKDKLSGKVLYLFNTHFDHKGEEARRKSALLIPAMVKKIAGDHMAVVTGDFNFDEVNPNYQLVIHDGYLKDVYTLTQNRYAPGGTFNAFDITADPKGRIDHIFIKGDFRVLKYGILTNTYHGRYPSDHFPVMAELEF